MRQILLERHLKSSIGCQNWQNKRHKINGGDLSAYNEQAIEELPTDWSKIGQLLKDLKFFLKVYGH